MSKEQYISTLALQTTYDPIECLCSLEKYDRCLCDTLTVTVITVNELMN